MLDYVFDSSAICDLGKLDEEEWNSLSSAWTEHRLATSWIPMAIAEITATNFIRSEDLPTEADLDFRQAGVHRLDDLAGRAILPEQNDRVRQSFYELAGEEPQESDVSDYRMALDDFVQVTSVSDLDISAESWAIRVGVTVPGKTDECRGLTVPLGFAEECEQSAEAWKHRTKLSGRATDSEIADEVRSYLPKMARMIATLPTTCVPPQIADRAIKSPLLETSALAYRALTENTHHLLRAIELRTGRVRDNDFRDIVVATYLADCGKLVTNDDRFEKFLGRFITNQDRVVPLNSAIDQILQGR